MFYRGQNTYLGPRCATGQVSLAFVTLGFFPIRFTEKSSLKFDRIEKNNTSTISFDLYINQTISWFHLLSPFKSRKHALRRAVKYSYPLKNATELK